MLFAPFTITFPTASAFRRIIRAIPTAVVFIEKVSSLFHFLLAWISLVQFSLINFYPPPPVCFLRVFICFLVECKSLLWK
jgi:hypothetical protein